MTTVSLLVLIGALALLLLRESRRRKKSDAAADLFASSAQHWQEMTQHWQGVAANECKLRREIDARLEGELSRNAIPYRIIHRRSPHTSGIHIRYYAEDAMHVYQLRGGEAEGG